MIWNSKINRECIDRMTWVRVFSRNQCEKKATKQTLMLVNFMSIFWGYATGFKANNIYVYTIDAIFFRHSHVRSIVRADANKLKFFNTNTIKTHKSAEILQNLSKTKKKRKIFFKLTLFIDAVKSFIDDSQLNRKRENRRRNFNTNENPIEMWMLSVTHKPIQYTTNTE